jgi:hypothetical protein
MCFSPSYIVNLGCIPAFCELLNEMDHRVILVALDAILSILNMNVPQYHDQVEQHGLDQIEVLQNFEHQQVSDRVRCPAAFYVYRSDVWVRSP